MGHMAPGSEHGLRHASLLYRSQDEFAAGVLPFVNAGVGAGDAVLVACTEPHLDVVRAQLDDRNGHVAWADMTSLGVNPGRMITTMRMFADEHPGQAVRFVQEPAWPSRSPAELREAIRHEALINLALARSSITVLCPYDARLDDAVIAGMRSTHPMLEHEGRRERSPSYTADPLVPADCDRPLSFPPEAAVLAYRQDLASVRHFAAGHACRAGLAPHRARDLVIAVGELAANTLAHTRGEGTLAVWVAHGEIICQVNDSGQISDPLAGGCGWSSRSVTWSRFVPGRREIPSGCTCGSRPRRIPVGEAPPTGRSGRQ